MKSWLFQEQFMDLDLYNDTYDIFCELLSKPGPLILEIGCGPGNITKYLLNTRPDFKIFAIDISPEMIKLANQNNPTADFKVMDCREIDTFDDTFDAIICGFCIPYLSRDDCSKLIKDCHDLLNGSGILYLSYVGGDYGQSGYQTGKSGDRMYFYYHNHSDLKITFEENDFEIVKILKKRYAKADGTNEIHTIVIVKKRILKDS